MSGGSAGADALVAVALVLVTVAATAAALTRDPVRQAAVLSGLGLCLTLLFLAVQAPDVALSQLAVGSALTPLLILLTVRKVRRSGRDDGTPQQAAPDAERNPAQRPRPDAGKDG